MPWTLGRSVCAWLNSSGSRDVCYIKGCPHLGHSKGAWVSQGIHVPDEREFSTEIDAVAYFKLNAVCLASEVYVLSAHQATAGSNICTPRRSKPYEYNFSALEARSTQP